MEKDYSIQTLRKMIKDSSNPLELRSILHKGYRGLKDPRVVSVFYSKLETLKENHAHSGMVILKMIDHLKEDFEEFQSGYQIRATPTYFTPTPKKSETTPIPKGRVNRFSNLPKDEAINIQVDEAEPGDLLNRVTRETYRLALILSNGNQPKAAKLLGIGYGTLVKAVKKHFPDQESRG